MFVSQTLLGFLDRAGVDFELVSHPHTRSSVQTAKAAHIELDQLAKAVLMRDTEELLLAVLPASLHVNPWAVSELTESPQLSLVQEEDLRQVFRDCERGALPAVGPAFGLRSVVDDALLAATDVYFEAGDHERLVHMDGPSFAWLMQGELHGCIGG
jgi:Ala-tRNA(Pro) deacylase